MQSRSDLSRPSVWLAVSLLAIVAGMSASSDARALAHGQVSGSGVAGAAPADVDAPSVAVDEASGAATLSIPVDLPPGPNGQNPNLRLSYSSLRGSGLLGVGWDLGLPKLVCSARFGVPTYAACERFELDGQVLVGPDSAGSYHTFDESFSRIERAVPNNIDSPWRVTGTDGTRMTLGGGPTSRVPGPGGTAEWHLSRIEDVFGNRIDFEYGPGPVGDEGELRPSRISYANGHREVRFVYEARPDPSVHYLGGLRRALSERLREIQVLVNNRLHHRLLLSYETAATTTQSRLIEVQRFGSDCDPSAHPNPTPTTCSALPPAEFGYTDSGHISAPERWVDTGEPTGVTGTPPYVTPPWYAPPGARFSTGDPMLRGQSSQFADLNGDGFPDIVTDDSGRQDGENLIDGDIGTTAPGPGAGPFVHLSTGVDGWEIPSWNGGQSEPTGATNVPDNASAIWTDRIRALRFDLPSLRVKQVFSFFPSSRPQYVYTGGPASEAVALGSCIGAGEDLPAVEFLTGAGSVQSGGRQLGGPAPYFDASAFRNAEQGYWFSPTPPYDIPAESEIRVWPHFQFVDLNADGLADMVMSIHLSGFYLSLDDCTSAQVQPVESATWIPGASARVVFMNTGDIAPQAETFSLDDGRVPSDGDYADSLPLFGIVAFESGDLAYEEIGKGEPRAPNSGNIASACDDYGLAGLREVEGNLFATSWDFCIAPIDLAPVFEDLNGDGYPDIIVKRPFDPTRPGHPDYPDGLFYNYDPRFGVLTDFEPVHRVGALESVAWLQNPSPGPGEDRWLRAPAYDPPVDHAFVAQFPGESPSGGVPPAFIDSRGNAQVYNIDNGVRFADLNRDGLADMLVSPRGQSQGYAVFPDGAALVNRGAGDPVGSSRYSAWCSSKALAGVDRCAEADRYTPPRLFVDGYATYDSSWGSPLGSITVISHQNLVSLADFNGDGWVDMLYGTDGGPRSGVYLHNPGASGSVWQKNDLFSPLEPFMYQDVPGGTYSGNAHVVPSGYAITDVNGDGVADIIGSDRSFVPYKHSWVSTPASARSDLLSDYENGQGLVVELEYTGAGQQRNASLEMRALAHSTAPLEDRLPENDGLAEPPGPDPVWPSVDDDVRWPTGPVLAAKRVSRPNAVETQTTYRYAHPRRCHRHKTDHGFRLVEATRGDASRVETFYFQKHGRTGKLAQQTIYDERGHPVHHRAEVWELPDPSTVTGGYANAASGDFGFAYLGRLRSRTSRNEYGSRIGESVGSEATTLYEYDDVHGYGFVAEILSDLPGRGTRTVRQPAPPDFANYLMDRPTRVRVFADQGGDQRLLSDAWLTYLGPDSESTFNKVGRTRVLDAKRDDPAASRWIRTEYKYASNGNLLEERAKQADSASSESRTTLYCYDGESDCAQGQSSRSILVGTRDAHGKWSRAEPHPVFAGPARSWSDYEDVPTLRSEFDPLGRVIEQWYEPSDGGAPVRLAATHFEDFPNGVSGSGTPVPPYRVERLFAQADASSAVESISVGDGLGGVSLSIDLLNAVSSGAASVVAVALETESDPNLRQSLITETFACGTVGVSGPEDYASVVAACSNVAASEKSATRSSLDVLGRPIEVVTPLGAEQLRYSATDLVVIGSGPHTPHDLVLERNPNGGLKETVFAAGKPVRIRECNNATTTPVTGFSTATCLDPDETRLVYEPTGELRERLDPTLANNDGYDGYNIGPWSNQILRYWRDTQGRVIQIDDPDAGTSHQTYDVFGNRSSAVDARGIEIRNFHDELNRLTRVEVDGESPTEIRYDDDLLSRERVADEGLDKFYSYDDLGRVWREIRWVDGRMLKVTLRHDYLDRPTRIKYPTVLDGAVDTIAYEYSGALLERVCDLGVRGQFEGDCDSETATDIISGVEYDAVGRVSTIGLPGGERRFEYDGHSMRRTLEAFASNVPGGGEDIRYAYDVDKGGGAGPVPAYDGLGNLLRVEATVADQSYAMEYDYDARNRLDSWTWDPSASGSGIEYDFDYDARANMILHAGEVQDFESISTAHAIQSRSAAGVTTNYSYDPAGHLASMSRSPGATIQYQFDGRGRLVCIGSLAARCNQLDVRYNGEGERVRESGAKTYLYAGSDFRLRPNAPGGQEYWIEIHALGERIAYKHVSGGALRIVGWLPGWEISPIVMSRLRPVAVALLMVIALALLLFVAGSRAPGQAVISLGWVVLAMALPVQARASFIMTNTRAAGSAVYRWVMSDAIGSGLAEIDASGQVLTHTAYTPFGRVAEESGSNGVGARSYFAGHDRQLNNDLVYMNARWMNPESGTFMSVDPLIPDGRDPQSYNGFSYARNNPLSLVDPTGRDWRIVWTDPHTGEVTSKGAWQSGSSVKAAAFVDGVKSGAISPATVTSNLANSGGSSEFGVPAAVGAGPGVESPEQSTGRTTGPATAQGTDVISQKLERPSLPANEQRLLDYYNNEIAGHEAAVDDLTARNEVLGRELSVLDGALKDVAQEIAQMADSARHVRSFQQADQLNQRIALKGLRALALTIKRERVQGRFDSNASFILGHRVQLGYLRRDRADFVETLR